MASKLDRVSGGNGPAAGNQQASTTEDPPRPGQNQPARHSNTRSSNTVEHLPDFSVQDIEHHDSPSQLVAPSSQLFSVQELSYLVQPGSQPSCGDQAFVASSQMAGASSAPQQLGRPPSQQDRGIPTMAAAEPLGACSHPDCGWTGSSHKAWQRHAHGCKGLKPRDPKHPGCTCCTFVPAVIVTTQPALSSLQATLALLPHFQHASVHEFLQGEFYRRADIRGRTYEAFFCLHI